MIVDTSVVIAILRDEPETIELSRILSLTHRKHIVAPGFLECCMVATRDRNEQALLAVNLILNKFEIQVLGFSREMADVAADCFLRYGKGRGHKAQLNFGDCMAYAASKVELMPLLFKGDNFRLTDVECAL
jgi:ribonuclease VapC